MFYDDTGISARKAERLAGQTPTLPHDGEAWRRYKRPSPLFPKKIPGNADALIFHAIDRLPDYSFFWYIEYDVAFSGDWRLFFQAFEASQADLITTSIRTKAQIPHWPLWRSLSPPPHVELADEQCLRLFLVVGRLSRRLKDQLAPLYQQGWTGHFEALLGTLALQQGLEVEDIGGDSHLTRPENLNRFYWNTPLQNSLSPGTLVFRPFRSAPGEQPNMLWHPIKQESRKNWDSGRGRLRQFSSKVLTRMRTVLNKL
ncbi:MAG: hypothetical protein VBE63_22250 [Lamprobacter sp.]|uniref:hypothetical protein n=1 Tax=Lamprobacter sp. TaxID=3100796 RepID=UPI002B263BB4|nr:hypothetical protein [Lamprobacter sp.]MEA3642640.1 hypothetical protein [Lamprobacter sp.]